MARSLVFCFGVLCLSITTAPASDKPQAAAPVHPSRLTEADVESTFSPVQHLRKAADHLDAAAVGPFADDLKREARELREAANELEQDAATHLIELKKQLPEIEKEISVWERLINPSRQIQVSLQIIEIDVAKARQLGLQIEWVPQDSAPESVVQVNATTPTEALQPHKALTTVVTSPKVVRGVLDSLVKEGIAKVLAEPTLITTNGRPASIRSGGEFPVPVPHADKAVSVEWREFGVKAEIVATTLAQGKVRLDVAAEISERDFANSTEVDGFVVPGIRTRRVNTQVEMELEQTMVIGGLTTSSVKSTNVQGIPVLDKFPHQDRVFRRAEPQEGSTEKQLVVLVTPRRVDATTN